MSSEGFHEVREVGSLAKEWNLIQNFGARDLKTKFKGSFLGWAWSLVVPLATIGIYTLVFMIIFRGSPPPMGTGQKVFVLWLFAGLTTWTFFASSINGGISALLGSGGMLQKVFFPAYAPVLGAGLAVGVQSIIELGMFLVIMVFMGNLGWTWLLLPFWMVLFVIFCQSLATTISIMNIYYRDLAHLVGIFLQLLFYVTPIIYPISMVPDSWRGIPLRFFIELNPLTQFIELYRGLVYSLQPGTWLNWAYILLWTAAALGLAVLTVRRRGRDLGEQI